MRGGTWRGGSGGGRATVGGAAGSLAAGVLAAGLAASCAASGPTGPLDGEAVYRARCALCHPLWSPTDFSPAEWRRCVGKYATRAGLTPGERDAVLAYLVREAARR